MKNLLLVVYFVFILPLSAWASDNPCERGFREIRANAMISGELKHPRDVDYYKITLKREGKLTASVRNLRASVVEIVDGFCFDIPERGSETSKAATLGPGDWFLKVYSNRGVTGKYDLYVRFKPGEQVRDMAPLMGASALPEPRHGDDHSNDCGHTTEVFMGSSTRGTFQGARDIDVFHIHLTQPTKLTVWTKGKANTRGILKDSFCRPIMKDSDSGMGKNFKIEARLQPGKYFISVSRGSGSQAREYTLVVRGAPLGAAGSQTQRRAAIDLTGTWKWVKTGESNTLGMPMNTQKGTVVFQQTGNAVEIRWAKKHRFSGVVDGNVLIFKRTFSRNGSVIREQVRSTFSSATRGRGTGTWTIRHNSTRGSGVDRYQFVKMKNEKP